MARQKTKAQKIIATLIIWVLIPLIIDGINILLLSGVLPFFMLTQEFSLTELAHSFGIWFVYTFIVMMFRFVRKKIVSKNSTQ